MSHTKRPVSFVAAALLALGLVTGPAQAADAPVLQRILQSGELRVGLSGDQPPYNTRDRDGNLIGLEVDLANLLAGALKVKAKLVPRPFPELLDALAAGEVDVVMSGIAITAPRSVQASFAGPYMLSGKSILTTSSTLEAAKSVPDLNRPGLRLAALARSTSADFVQRLLPQATLVTVPDYTTAVDRILAGEVDALVADMPICVITAMRHPGKGLGTLGQPLTVEPIGVAVPASDPQLLNLVDNYLDAFEATGLLEAIRAKWLENDSWLAALP